ncbi:hypothetical protein PR048_018639 [Dryococelus australis]|uniref:BEN domain-containing protein n=1 Tax=Dryococelus australis TaxID=614101 RepID=A0ABQ9HCU8_9NEOP|nr:hypothetical protein PR048_018639 [Dryococelus australis]
MLLYFPNGQRGAMSSFATFPCGPPDFVLRKLLETNRDSVTGTTYSVARFKKSASHTPTHIASGQCPVETTAMTADRSSPTEDSLPDKNTQTSTASSPAPVTTKLDDILLDSLLDNSDEDKTYQPNATSEISSRKLCALVGTIIHGFQNVGGSGKFTPENKTTDSAVARVKSHIEKFPVMESYYCRKASGPTRTYLDSKLSIAKMHDLYVSECKEQQNISPVTLVTYRRIS